MKKTLLRSMLLTMVCALVVSTIAFVGNFSVVNAAASKITLTIEASQEVKTGNPSLLYQPNIDAFQKKYPNIKIEQLLIPDAQIQTTLQVKLAAGEPSDIVIFNKVSAENELNAMKNFVDVSNEPWVKRTVQPGILKSPDGKIYGWLLKAPTGGMGVVYNKDIFANLKIAIPKTYASFLKACETIKASGITPIYGPFKDSWTFQILPDSVLANYAFKRDPTLFDKINANKLKWSDVKVFGDILQKASDLVKNGYVQSTCLADDYNGAPAAFSSKKYAMMFMGDWFTSDMLKKDPSLKLGMFPIPGFDDGTPLALAQSQLGAVMYIPKKAKHNTEAKLFLDFMSQKEQVNAAQKAEAFLPFFKDANTIKLPQVQQDLQNNYINKGAACSEMNAYMKVDLGDLWKYYQDMIAGGKTPQEVSKAWDTKFDSLMKQKKIAGF